MLLSGKSSQEVAEAFQTAWVSWAGPPVQILHDQGTEFAKDFTALARRLGAETRVTPTEAPWQNIMVERHGAVLGEVLAALVQQYQLEGERDMRLGGTFAAAAKNRRPDRSGHSARSPVFDQTRGAIPRVDRRRHAGRREPRGVGEGALGPRLRPQLGDPAARAVRAHQARQQRGLAPGAHLGAACRTRCLDTGSAGLLLATPESSARAQGQEGKHGGASMARTGHGLRPRGPWRAADGQLYWLAHNGYLLLVAPEHIRSATREEGLSSAVKSGHDRHEVHARRRQAEPPLLRPEAGCGGGAGHGAERRAGSGGSGHGA